MAATRLSTRILLVSCASVIFLLLTYHGAKLQLSSDNRLVVFTGVDRRLDKGGGGDLPHTVNHTLSQRKAMLKNWCLKKTILQSLDYRDAKHILHGYDWMYMNEYKLFYCSIPKSGSSTMKSVLMESLGIPAPKTNQDLHDHAAHVLGLFEDNKSKSVLNVPLARSHRNPFYPEKQSSHSLIIVRDPWQRLVSAYQNRVKELGKSLIYYCVHYAKARHMDKTTPSFNISFSEFVDCVTSNHVLGLPFYDDHIFPMTKLCSICLIDYDLIVKLEDFDKEMGYVLSVIDGDTTELKKNLLKKRQHLNPTRHTDHLQYYRQLNERQVSLLQDMYRDDFIVFGYSSDLNLQ